MLFESLFFIQLVFSYQAIDALKIFKTHYNYIEDFKEDRCHNLAI